MSMLRLAVAVALCAAAAAFPCRTARGAMIYPYVYFKTNPMGNGNAQMFVAPPDATAEPDDDDAAPVGVQPATMEPATMEPATMAPTTMEPTTMGPMTTEPTTMEPMTTEPTTTTGREPRRGARRGAPSTESTGSTGSTGSMESMESMPPNDAGGKLVCVACARRNFDDVNRYRASLGLSQLRWMDGMAAEAAAHSKDMYERNYFEHSDLPYWENIAMNWGSNRWDDISDGLFDQWKKSPGHDANMRRPTHECGGVGVYGDGDKFYGTQVFSNKC